MSKKINNFILINLLFIFSNQIFAIDKKIDEERKKINDRFIRSAKYGFVDAVKKLVEQKLVDINAQNEEGNTALMVAINAIETIPIIENRIEIVNFLLKNNADPNIKNYEGETSLVLACRVHNNNLCDSLIDLLIDYGADVTIQDRFDKISERINPLRIINCLNVGTKINQEDLLKRFEFFYFHGKLKKIFEIYNEYKSKKYTKKFDSPILNDLFPHVIANLINQYSKSNKN